MIEKHAIFEDLTKEFVRRIAWVADTHCGSKCAVSPPGVKDENGVEFILNEGQNQLYENWLDFCGMCDSLDVDSIFVVGDAIDGPNPKEGGIGLMTPDLDIQVNIAKELYKPLIGNRKSYWFAGSDYHIGTKGYNTEKDVCNSFKDSTWMGVIANARLSPTDKIANIFHGGGEGTIYRETAIGRDILFGKTAYADDKLPKFSLYVRAHKHWFYYGHYNNVHYLQVPCWKAFTSAKIFIKGYTRYQPDIGGFILLIDKEGRFRPWHMLYPLPHISDKEITL